MLKRILKHKLTESQLQLLFFIIFICIGALYANLSVSKHIEDYRLIFDFFGNRIKDQTIVKTDLFEYLLFSRFKILIGLWIVGFILFAYYINVTLTSFFGFNLGLILSSALIFNGFSGYGLILMLFFPQAIFYVPIYLYITSKNNNFSKALYRNRKTTKSFKINGQLLLEYFLVLAICGVFLLIGISFEAYVNPDLIKWYISTINL